jgi:hypothetical protein
VSWVWGAPDVVRLTVTATGADGAGRRWYVDLGAGPDGSVTITLPDGTEVTLLRPVRVRVDLREHRAARRVPTPPARPKWRDDSALIMSWRTWLAVREGRLAARELHQKRGEAAT